jgi:hypothetical protein
LDNQRLVKHTRFYVRKARNYVQQMPGNKRRERYARLMRLKAMIAAAAKDGRAQARQDGGIEVMGQELPSLLPAGAASMYTLIPFRWSSERHYTGNWVLRIEKGHFRASTFIHEMDIKNPSAIAFAKSQLKYMAATSMTRG